MHTIEWSMVSFASVHGDQVRETSWGSALNHSGGRGQTGKRKGIDHKSRMTKYEARSLGNQAPPRMDGAQARAEHRCAAWDRYRDMQRIISQSSNICRYWPEQYDVPRNFERSRWPPWVVCRQLQTFGMESSHHISRITSYAGGVQTFI